MDFLLDYRNCSKETCRLYIVYIFTTFTLYFITNITSVVNMDMLTITTFIFKMKNKINNRKFTNNINKSLLLKLIKLQKMISVFKTITFSILYFLICMCSISL